MNILFSCDDYPPIKDCGIGVVTKTFAEALVKKGHRVFVVSAMLWGEKLPFESKINGVMIYRLSYYKWLRFFHFLPERFRDLLLGALNKSGLLHGVTEKELRKIEMFIRNIIQKEKIDLFELPDYIDMIEYFRKPIKFERFLCPTVMRTHGSHSFLHFYENGVHNKKEKLIDMEHFSRVDFVSAVSIFSGDYVINELKVPKEKVTVIYNSCDNRFFDIKDMLEKQNNIVFFSKIIETKGAFSLLKAFNRIASKYPEITLSLIGRGEIEKAKTFVEKEHSNRVKFCGYVSREQLQEAILSSMFCVFPTYFENFSIAALEILASKTALIYTKRASGPELIDHGINGLLVDPESVDEIFDAMDLLISDDSLRNKIAEEGFKRVFSQFKEEKIIDQIEEFYKKCTEKNNFK